MWDLEFPENIPCFQFAKRWDNCIFPYNLPAFHPMTSFSVDLGKYVGIPTSTIAFFFVTQNVFAMVMRSPHGLIRSPYLKRIKYFVGCIES
jgi:hypothetical protein